METETTTTTTTTMSLDLSDGGRRDLLALIDGALSYMTFLAVVLAAYAIAKAVRVYFLDSRRNASPGLVEPIDWSSDEESEAEEEESSESEEEDEEEDEEEEEENEVVVAERVKADWSGSDFWGTGRDGVVRSWEDEFRGKKLLKLGLGFDDVTGLVAPLEIGRLRDVYAADLASLGKLSSSAVAAVEDGGFEAAVVSLCRNAASCLPIFAANEL